MSAQCMHCNRWIRWEFNENGKKIPRDYNGANHLITCEKARTALYEKNKQAKQAERQKSESLQPTLFK